MKPLPSILAATLLASVALTISSRATTRYSELTQTPSGDTFPNKSVVIYVADFDIDALRAKDEKNSAAPIVPSATADSSSSSQPVTPVASPQNLTGSPTPASGQEAKKTDAPKAEASRTDSQRPDLQRIELPKDDSPAAQAAKLVDLTSVTLVKALEQAGYTARRLRNSAARPDDGVVLRGVFAQADASAGLRRVVLGGDVTDSKMVLFVGVGNLSRPDQAVYLPVGPGSADGRLGPVISVSVYAPVSRFNLDRDPSEELLKNTSTKIVSEMTTLLNANPLAVNQ
jgi:hypothetical protein